MKTNILLLSDANNVHTYKWATFFRDNNFKVGIISMLPAEIEGVQIYQLKSKTYAKRKNNLEYNRFKVFFEMLPQIKKIIYQIKPEILHAHFVSSYGLFGALTNYHPYFLSAWGYDTITFPDKNFLNKTIVKFALSKADKIFATSRFLAEKTNRFTKKNIIITPFGVNIDKFSPIKEKRSKKEKFIWGTIKALYPKYGIRYLIEAAKIINEKIPNWELIIAGEGSEKETLINLAKKYNIETKIKFLGKIPHETVPETIKQMDIFVVPSIWECESFGVAAVEASACGIPVIASRIGGLPEVVVNNKTGFLVTPKSAQEIANKILYFYNNPLEKEKMGSEARKFVVDNYEWKKNAQIMLDIYKEVIK